MVRQHRIDLKNFPSIFSSVTFICHLVCFMVQWYQDIDSEKGRIIKGILSQPIKVDLTAHTSTCRSKQMCDLPGRAQFCKFNSNICCPMCRAQTTNQANFSITSTDRDLFFSCSELTQLSFTCCYDILIEISGSHSALNRTSDYLRPSCCPAFSVCITKN